MMKRKEENTGMKRSGTNTRKGKGVTDAVDNPITRQTENKKASLTKIRKHEEKIQNYNNEDGTRTKTPSTKNKKQMIVTIRKIAKICNTKKGKNNTEE